MSFEININEIPEHTWKMFQAKRFELWAEFAGIKVDQRRFSFKGHKFAIPLFRDRSEQMVLMKSAQMGATIWMLLKAFHMALYYKEWDMPYPPKIGFYFPEAKGVGRMVRDRVQPMMESCDDLIPYSREPRQDLKPVGDATLYFLYMGGSSTKDSVPLSVLFFDEVRLVDINDIFQAHNRSLAQEKVFKHHVSTAGLPESDIHAFFLESDRKWYHTRCQSCGHHQILASLFPNCIAEYPAHSTQAGKVFYKCEKCGSEIKDTSQGGYIAEMSERVGQGWPSGYHISQLIRKSAQDIWSTYNISTNRQDFYNSILGLPYVDLANKPISIDMLDRNVNPHLKWGDRLSGGRFFMGIDQMQNLNYVYILKRVGKKREIVWMEIIEDADPFKRCSQLMEEYDVEVCVCDALPNTNDALKFAGDFPSRVFLAYYANYTDMVRWDEHRKAPRVHKRAEPETYTKFRVYLDQYASIDYTLQMLSRQMIEWPDPKDLTQTVNPLKKGIRKNFAIMESHAYPMFACAVRQKKVLEEASGRYRMTWNFVALDPHALHALNYAVFASERKQRHYSLSF